MQHATRDIREPEVTMFLLVSSFSVHTVGITVTAIYYVRFIKADRRMSEGLYV